jgi:hypothetical protein
MTLGTAPTLLAVIKSGMPSPFMSAQIVDSGIDRNGYCCVTKVDWAEPLAVRTASKPIIAPAFLETACPKHLSNISNSSMDCQQPPQQKCELLLELRVTD